MSVQGPLEILQLADVPVHQFLSLLNDPVELLMTSIQLNGRFAHRERNKRVADSVNVVTVVDRYWPAKSPSRQEWAVDVRREFRRSEMSAVTAGDSIVLKEF